MKFIYIDSICTTYGIDNYTINSDGTVDVDNDVNLSSKKLTKLPLKFGKVSGNFFCSDNYLTTLEGSPQSVGGNFNCRSNYLKTLEFCPKSVGGYFSFYKNSIKDLYGFPEFFYGHIFYGTNPVSETLNLFNGNRKMEAILSSGNLGKVINLLNEYDVIQQDGKLVILDRLEEVFYTLGMELPEINLKNYEVY